MTQIPQMRFAEFTCTQKFNMFDLTVRETTINYQSTRKPAFEEKVNTMEASKISN